MQHGFQDRQQPGFRDLRRGAHHLPLRHFVHGVDVKQTLDSVQVTLMDGVHAQISRPALRIGLASLANGHCRGPGSLISHAALAVRPAFAQPVELRHREPRQALVRRVVELMPCPLQNLLRGRTAEGFVGLVHCGQHFDVGPRVTVRKSMPLISSWLHFAALLVAPNQARHLRPAQTGHLSQVAPHQSFALALEVAVILPAQALIHPRVQFPPVLGMKTHLSAGFHKRPHLFQAQWFSVFHADDQSPACGIPPSGSSCMRNNSRLQAHLA